MSHTSYRFFLVGNTTNSHTKPLLTDLCSAVCMLNPLKSIISFQSCFVLLATLLWILWNHSWWGGLFYSQGLNSPCAATTPAAPVAAIKTVLFWLCHAAKPVSDWVLFSALTAVLFPFFPVSLFPASRISFTTFLFAKSESWKNCLFV